MNFQTYLQHIIHGWWLLVAMLLISIGIGISYSYSQQPIYEATTSFLANPTLRMSETQDTLWSLDTLASRGSLIETYCLILQSGAIFEKAAGKLGIFPQDLTAYSARCTVLPNSSVLQLRVQGPSPELATELTTAIGSTGVQYIAELQEVFELRTLDGAVIPTEPIFPNHVLNIGFSVLAGLLGGIIALLIRIGLSSMPPPSSSDMRQETHTAHNQRNFAKAASGAGD